MRLNDTKILMQKYFNENETKLNKVLRQNIKLQ